MKLLIDIPKEFEQQFQADRFDDSLHRLSADAHLLAGLYEQETAMMLSEAFKNAVPIPPHGRLIDADALKDFFPDKGEGSWTYNIVVSGIIRDAPTIIPASDKDTNVLGKEEASE